MKREFEEYLRAINMPNAFMERIENLFPYVHLLCPDDITTLFVTDYFQQDGTREYGSAFFFSEHFVCEAKQFVAENDIDITPLKNEVYYVVLKTQDYDLQNATEKSRVYVKVFSKAGPTDLQFELRASQGNCNYAVRIISDILQPNLSR
jgi:hypothetical protein